MSRTRRGLARVAVLGILALMLRSPAATAQDPAAMPLPDLIAEASNLPPIGLYTPADRLFASGRREDAMVWFYITQIRSRLRLTTEPGLPPDGEPALYASLNDVLGREINGWAFGDVDRAAALIDRALDWDRTHANAFTPKSGHEAALEHVRSIHDASSHEWVCHEHPDLLCDVFRTSDAPDRQRRCRACALPQGKGYRARGVASPKLLP